MPKLTAEGRYQGVCKRVILRQNDKTGSITATFEMETEEGAHGYPNPFLTNKDGSPNAATLEMLNRLFGWDGDDLDNLETIAQGKSCEFDVKPNGEHTNYWLVDPNAPKKDTSAIKSAWAAKRGKVAPAGGGSADLHISEANIPFAPCK